jgi:hypothetical protein
LGKGEVDVRDLKGSRDPGRMLLSPSREEELCWGKM